MIDLGTVLPGATLRIPFSSFDKDDGSSITMTNYSTADILIYKDGSTTERASTAGYTATTDFDGKTGKHLAIIDLADDTTADFFKAGSEYLVAIDAVTVDAVTTGGWIARFRIGYPGAQIDTSIATLASQTSFTLTSGPAEDDALNGMWAVVHDKASAVQTTRVVVLDYTGSTKTVTLVAAGTFTIAAGDNFSLMGQAALQPTVTGRTLDVSSTGEGGLDWANIGSPTTAQSLTATRILGLTGTIGEFDDFVDPAGKVTLNAASVTSVWTDTTATDFTVALSIGKSIMNGVSLGTGLTVASVSGAVGSVTGAVGSVTGAVGSVTGNVGGNVTGSVGSVAAGGIAAASFAAGAIDASAIAADAIGSSELAASAANEIADAILDRASAIEGYTVRQAMRLVLAALAAKLSGAATTTVAIRDIADTKDRITATVDANGNRTAITLDAT